jgi:Gpi18-like mannosyltransferase
MSETERVLLGKLGIAVVCVVVMFVVVSIRQLREISKGRFTIVALALLLLSRLGVYVGIYFVLGQSVTADVAGAYYPEGKAILQGAVLYDEVQTSYAPLFPFIMAAIVLLWDSPKAIVLFAIILEAISLPFWIGAGRQLLGDATTRMATMLYVTCPIAVMNVALNGQNQVAISLVMAIALLLIVRRRDYLSGLVFGLSVAAVKLLGFLFAPVLWLLVERRWSWLAGFVVLPVVVYGVCLAFGLDVLVPVRLQGMHVTAGNLPFFLSIFGLDMQDQTVRVLVTIVVLLGLIIVFLTAWALNAREAKGNLVHLVTLVLLTFLVLSKKSYTSYLVLCLFALCLSIASRPMGWRALVWFAVFSIVASIEPTLWFRWMEKHDFGVLWRADLPEGMDRWQIVAFLCCELVLLLSYVGYFIRTWHVMIEASRAQAGDRAGPPASSAAP